MSDTFANTAQLTDQWRTQGYLILPGVIDADRMAQLSSLCLPAFENWAQTSATDGEPGGWHYKPDGFVMLHLNHPRHHQHQRDRLPVLLDTIADVRVLNLLQQIFGSEPLFNQNTMYYDPPEQARQSSWHRDSQFFCDDGDDATLKKLIAAEAAPPRELHMHIPLLPTAHTQLVPGSHDRWDTPEEHHIRTQNSGSDDMPNALTVKLSPGDLAFFHVNALHRGLYPVGQTRRTISVTYSHPQNPRPADAALMKKWQGYVASYQPWSAAPDYLAGTAPTTRAFFNRFVQTYQSSWQPNYLDPLPGFACLF